MMNDHQRLNGGQHESTVGRASNNLDTPPRNHEIDMLVHSESAQIQEFRLYRELSREIERNLSDRVRYVDSELYLRTQDRYSNPSSSQSETQSTTVNIGLNQQSSSVTSSSSPAKAAATANTKSKPTTNDNLNHNHHQHGVYKASSSGGSKYDEQRQQSGNDSQHTHNSNNADTDAAANRKPPLFIDGNCQVCLIKELKDDLTHVTRVIQERNEQLSSKLKARRLRTFFERQMLD